MLTQIGGVSSSLLAINGSFQYSLYFGTIGAALCLAVAMLFARVSEKRPSEGGRGLDVVVSRSHIELLIPESEMSDFLGGLTNAVFGCPDRAVLVDGELVQTVPPSRIREILTDQELKKVQSSQESIKLGLLNPRKICIVRSGTLFDKAQALSSAQWSEWARRRASRKRLGRSSRRDDFPYFLPPTL